MESTSIRLDDELLRRIDEGRGDLSRSKWLRRAAREKLNEPEVSPVIADLRADVDDLEARVDALEQQSLVDRIFKTR